MTGKKQPETPSIPPEELYIRILTFFSDSERYFTPDMPLAEVVNEKFEDEQFTLANISFELILGVDITSEMIDLARIGGMTVGEFARAVAGLPPVRDCLHIARFVLSVARTIAEIKAGEETS